MAAMIHRIVPTPPPHSRAAMTKSTVYSLPSQTVAVYPPHGLAKPSGKPDFWDLPVRSCLAEGDWCSLCSGTMDVQSRGWLMELPSMIRTRVENGRIDSGVEKRNGPDRS